MKIDIILITYNQERFIKQALESIFIQSVPNEFEVRIIVADDCSTDCTMHIIRELEQYSPFPFTYLVNSQNIGLQLNYKNAFSSCEGDYTLILEGDDYWCSPHHIVQHVNFLDEHRECGMSVNGFVLFWQESGIFEFNRKFENNTFEYISLREQILWNQIGNFSATCIRTSLLKRIPEKMYNYKFADWLVGMVVAQYGFIALLNVYSSVYRKHNLGVWSGTEISKREFSFEELSDIYDDYSHVLDDKYKCLFDECLESHRPKPIPRKSKVSVLKIYIPPLIYYFLKLLIPRFMLNILRNF